MSSLPSTYVEGFHCKESISKMRYNDLGNTGLRVSALSFGGGALSKFYDTFDEEEAIATIREAIKCGINFIDTAPWYGQGQSETIIGKALKGIPREAYYIATKVGRYEPNYEEMFNFSAKKVEHSFNDSLQKLGIDYVDIIQVHDIEFAPNLDIILNETLPCLMKMQKEGKTKFIGVTGYPLSVLRNAIEQSTVQLHTVLTYCRNTLIDSSLNDYVDFFKENNIGIICAAGHGMGLLTNNGPQDWHPGTDKVKEVCRKAADYCKLQNIELGRIAIWHSMNHPSASTHLVGMSNLKLLRSNLSVFYDGITSEEENILKKLNDEYFSQVQNTNWEGVELEKYWNYMKSIK